MKDKKREKSRGMKHKISEEKKREERIGLAIAVTILIAIVSGFLIHSMLSSSLQNRGASLTSEPKAALVDQLSLTARACQGYSQCTQKFISNCRIVTEGK